MRNYLFLILICASFTFFSCSNNETKDANIAKTDSVKKPEPIIDGTFLKLYENGARHIEGEMKNAKRTGPWKAWYPDGTIWSEGEYKDGKREGKSTVYFENGTIRYEGNYKDDKQVGIWKYYDENGKQIEEKNYDQVQ